MSREFKFRAWNKENKKMILPYENVGEDELMISFSGRLITIENNNACGADDCCGPNENYVSESDHKCYEIMQNTGLKDKNGKEIYEGDLLSYERNWSSSVSEIVFHKVEWSEEGGWLPFIEVWSDELASYDILKDCKVIGNIYENEDIISG
jgi:uncharacterized phage protein (TIGR01671 family)